jgi:L-iditol 2-dehydrogenase
MKALVKYSSGPGNVEIRDVEEPYCGEDQVKIEVAYCGICGTDLSVYRDEFRNYPPVILGHEFSGTVTEVGSRVSNTSPGSRVAVLPASAVTCGECLYCRTGRFMFCAERRGMGHGVNGAFTQYVVVNRNQIYSLPADLPVEEGALWEPLAAAVQPVHEISGAQLGDVALVSGPGPIGLLCLKLLVAEGIQTIVAVTTADDLRSAAARSIGADKIVNVEETDLRQAVLEETSGQGVDVAFECAGAASSAVACMDALRPLGCYVQVGIFGNQVQLPFDTVIYKQLVVRGSVGYTVETWRRVQKIIQQGRVQLGDLISHKLPLEEWQKGFDLCRKQAALKVLLRPESL